MKILIALVCALCVFSVRAQEGSEDDFQEELIQPAELTENVGEKFDDVVNRFSRIPTPPQLPSAADLARATFSISGKDLVGETAALPGFEFAKRLPTSKHCCPRKWNYGCRSTSHPLPCFYDNITRGWCCPVFPKIWTRHCACNKCLVQDTHCFREGTCAKRYQKCVFWAVCWKQNSWGFIKKFTKAVASSCYCKAKPQISNWLRTTSKLLPAK